MLSFWNLVALMHVLSHVTNLWKLASLLESLSDFLGAMWGHGIRSQVRMHFAAHSLEVLNSLGFVRWWQCEGYGGGERGMRDFDLPGLKQQRWGNLMKQVRIWWGVALNKFMSSLMFGIHVIHIMAVYSDGNTQIFQCYIWSMSAQCCSHFEIGGPNAGSVVTNL